jgi:hypothetical protein
MSTVDCNEEANFWMKKQRLDENEMNFFLINFTFIMWTNVEIFCYVASPQTRKKTLQGTTYQRELQCLQTCGQSIVTQLPGENPDDALMLNPDRFLDTEWSVNGTNSQ